MSIPLDLVVATKTRLVVKVLWNAKNGSPVGAIQVGNRELHGPYRLDWRLTNGKPPAWLSALDQNQVQARVFQSFPSGNAVQNRRGQGLQQNQSKGRRIPEIHVGR